MAHNVGDIVYYDDNRLMVIEGPFRTLDYPNVEQYNCKAANGTVRSCWATDLMTEEQYIESYAEEGCRE